MGKELFFSSSSMNCEYVGILYKKENIGDILYSPVEFIC